MAPLPGTYVIEAISLTRTGQDYLGLMIIKTSDGQMKVWVCLFTCMVTRTIHLCHRGAGSLDGRVLRKIIVPCEKSLTKISKSTVTNVRSNANSS